MTPRVLLVALLAGTALVGCSGDSSETSPSSTSTATPPSTPTDDEQEATPPTTDPGPDFGDVATAAPGAAGEATGPLGSTELRIDTDAGTVQIGAGSVPERLGADFPLPPDFVVELASETTPDLGVSGTSEVTFDELIDLFENGLPAAGYTVESFDRRDDEFAVFDFSNDDGIGQVAISEAPGPPAHFVFITFGDRDEDQAEN